MPNMKYAQSRFEFQEEAKEYVINMISDSRVLHKKNGCYYGEFSQKYYDFDTEEEASNSNIAFRHCLNCFPEKKEG